MRVYHFLKKKFDMLHEEAGWLSVLVSMAEGCAWGVILAAALYAVCSLVAGGRMALEYADFALTFGSVGVLIGGGMTCIRLLNL